MIFPEPAGRPDVVPGVRSPGNRFKEFGRMMGNGRKRRALIVDDHDGTRQAMRRLLTLHGFETREAATLTAALAELECCEFVL